MLIRLIRLRRGSPTKIKDASSPGGETVLAIGDKTEDAQQDSTHESDPKAVNNRMTKMVNCFKYYIKKDEQTDKAAQAKQALVMYEAIHGNNNAAQMQRREFLAQFESGGGGRGKDGLKWVVEYSKSAVHEDKKQLATTENYFTRQCH